MSNDVMLLFNGNSICPQGGLFMQVGLQVFAGFLYILHFASYPVSYLLYSRCAVKTPRLRKRLLLKSLIPNAVLNTVLIFVCLSRSFPGRGVISVARDVFSGAFSYQDLSRLSVSSFLCLTLSMALTLLCCVLYRRWDDRVETTPRQRGLAVAVVILSAVPAIAGYLIGGSGARALKITGVCRRYEVRVIDEKTQKDLPEDYSAVTLRNTGVLKNEAPQVFLSVEQNDPQQIAVKGLTLMPGEEYTLVMPANDSLIIKKAGGSTVYLSDGSGNFLDQVSIPALKEGEHYQKAADEWQIVAASAPAVEEAPVVVPAPVFSAESGFYDEPFDLTLSAEPGLKIYYTLDCSEPDVNATPYTASIYVYDKSSEPDVIHNAPGLLNNYLENPRKVVYSEKCMIVRAVTQDKQGNLSEIVSHSYFIGQNLSRFKNGSVLSIISSPDGLIGNNGILVTGAEYDAWYQNAFNSMLPGDKLNRTNAPIESFNKQGLEWERKAEIQVYSHGSLEHKQFAGIRVLGNSNRRNINKRLSIFARKEYSGSSLFAYPLINSYRQHSMSVRSGDLFAISQRLSVGRDTLTVDCRPVWYFLNGELFYAGYLCEKFDEKNIASKYNLTDDNILLVKNGEYPNDYPQGLNPYTNIVITFIKNAKYDLSTADGYNALCKIADMQSYIDTYCINAYLANTDLSDIDGNTLLMRTYNTEFGQWGDKRWRWGLIDMDLEWSGEVTGIGKSEPWRIGTFTAHASWNIARNKFALYAACKVNPVFCRQFVLTFMDLVNTIFSQENTTNVLDKMDITNEQYRTFFEKRAEYAVPDLAEEFTLTGTQETVTLSANRGSAPITLNTITPELKDGQWSGTYFTDYPVTVTANARGFDHWEVTAGGVTESYTESTIEVPVVKGGVRIHAVYQ